MNQRDFDRFAWHLGEELSILNAAMQSFPVPAPAFEDEDDTDDDEDEDAIQEYPVIPGVDMVVFPKLAAPLYISRESTRRALEAAQEEDLPLLVLAQRDPNVENPDSQDLYEVGCEITIGRVLRMPDGTQSLF